MSIFKGAGVAIVTPMKSDLEVNYDKLAELLEEQIAGKTDAIIICGTTGESATMSEEEHSKVIRFAIERVNHRIPVIAGTGSNSTRTAIQLSQEAAKDGADGLLLVTPYYNKATQNGLIAHYTQICNSVDIPAILYNVPSRTGCAIQPTTVAHLVKNVDKLKELGFEITLHDKMPDVVLYREDKDWIYFVESVTSVGPMDPKRILEITEMTKDVTAGKIFVTAFLDFKTYKKFAEELAWETEVWIAEMPEHMIHLNGDRFMGPRG